jgi:hypothetical protein
MTLKRRTNFATKGKQFGIGDAVTLIAATSLAMAGLRSDDLAIVLPCLIIACASFLYLEWVNVPRKGLRYSLMFAVSILFLLFASHVLKKQQEAIEGDVFNHLSVEMNPIDMGRPMYLLYTIKNGSSHTIASQKATCLLHGLNTQSGEILKGPGLFKFSGLGQGGPIDAGGGAETGRCAISERISFDSPIQCMDVTMKIEYQLSSEADAWKEKSMRFVASQTTGPHWFPESPDTPGNYCDGLMNTSH